MDNYADRAIWRRIQLIPFEPEQKSKYGLWLHIAWADSWQKITAHANVNEVLPHVFCIFDWFGELMDGLFHMITEVPLRKYSRI